MKNQNRYSDTFWVGVVEDSKDPLKIGRARVRVFGVHSPDKSILPTNKLPWAFISASANSPNSYSWIREGNWVTGYFVDADQYQTPIILGVLPGLESSQSIETYEASSPEISSPYFNPEAGDPTLPPSAIGNIEKTPIAKTNRERSHVCDISQEVIQATGWVRAHFGVVVEGIRRAIRAALKAFGIGERTGEIAKLVQMSQAIKREIQKINDIVVEIRELTQVILEISRQIRSMIDYILSLPEKIRQFLSECLEKLYTSLRLGIENLFTKPVVGSVPTGSISDLISEVNNVVSEGATLFTNIREVSLVPAQAIQNLINPSNTSDIEQAGNIFNETVSKIFPSNEELVSSTTTEINKTSI